MGTNIKYLRREKGLSQEELAEKINKSRNYIGMIERAEANAPVLTLYSISKALEVKPKDLFDFD